MLFASLQKLAPQIYVIGTVKIPLAVLIEAEVTFVLTIMKNWFDHLTSLT